MAAWAKSARAAILHWSLSTSMPDPKCSCLKGNSGSSDLSSMCHAHTPRSIVTP